MNGEGPSISKECYVFVENEKYLLLDKKCVLLQFELKKIQEE